MTEATLDELADLIVGLGANVQPGQIVAITSEPGKEDFTRALAASAYRAGAKYVDPWYFDYHVKKARLVHGREEDLTFVPPWYSNRLRELSERRCARIALTGTAHPHLFADVDPARAGKDQLPALQEGGDVVNARTTNWCGVPCPTPGWAALVHPDLPEEEAYDKLWEQILHILRMDCDDPRAAWQDRVDALKASAAKLNERRFDAIRFRGEGTDLTVGLLGGSRWLAAQFDTVEGITHMPNLPSEEVFTTPDPERTEGVVTATKPLSLGGSIIRGLRVEFAGGRVTKIDADENAEVLRGYVELDADAGRLGEVALVDAEGRIGPLNTVFYDTLLDENAASHIALGSAYTFAVEGDDVQRANHSAIHVDFMIGSPEMEVDGTTTGGETVPVLRGGAWQV
ncbi:MAG: aminopeptidase [Solirubrobacteraceae bacterium]|nr:aminopeptidase [Solirubrobacteraceae bacterium]